MSTARRQRRRVEGDGCARATVVAAPRVDGHRDHVAGKRRFVMGDELGRGGMGRVVAAVDTMLERDVAIKHALDDVDAMRFEREAQITAQLEHPSIVPIHDAGRDEHGRPFYIMRRIAGEPLAHRIAASCDASTRLALVPRFVIAVDAAGFAHARRIVHRDIKPHNILLGAHGETLLIDWGLALEIDEPDGSTGGTPGYMAPEQERGEPVDARADVYALGVTLLDILTLPAARDRNIPEELVAIAFKASATRPDDRYRDGSELAADLRAFLDGHLVAAHRYTTLARLGRLLRRHRLVVAIVALAVIAIAMIGVVAIHRVVSERDRAELGQQLAADRADILLLDRASGLATRDPTRTVALLQTLPPGSSHLGRARDIAAIASLHGIEHGIAAHDGPIVGLAIAPDGHHALSAGGYDGTIQVHDLTTGARRTIVRGPVVDHAIWTDHGATITYAARGLRIVDVATGAVRVLVPDVAVASVWAPSDGNRVRFHDDTRHVVAEISTSGGDIQLLASDAHTVASDDELVAVAGAGTVRMVSTAGEHVIGRYTGAVPGTLAMSGDHVAAGFHDTTIEWNVNTGRRHAWPGITAPVYAGHRLYGANTNRTGQLDVLFESGTYEALAADWSVQWSTPAGPRIAVIDASGDLALLGENSNRELRFDRPGSRLIAGRRDSPYLAAGSNDGTIRWWDLRRFAPESRVVPDSAVCGVDAEHIYVRPPGQFAVVSRSGGATRTFDSDGTGCPNQHVGSRFVTMSPDGGSFDVIDSATGHIAHVAGDPIVGNDAIYFAHGRSLYEVTDREPRARWTAPADMLGVVVVAGSFGVELDDGRLVRVDIASASETSFEPTARPTAFTLGIDGSWWYAVGARVYHDGALIGELSSPVQTLWVASSGDCLVFTEEQSIWRARPHALDRLGSVVPGRLTTLGDHVVATVSNGAARFIYVETGEEMTVYARDASAIQIFDDDRMFAIVRTADTVRVDLYTDSVP
ncbi:MAG TPA: WD40 repeat domain-containing serine/threonine protein kinase, partial [Kofleriaceae bacterium]|nr:WD40 repeat domain-containing serine/threonine protein kinase [Kofleriaceae bacterium]